MISLFKIPILLLLWLASFSEVHSQINIDVSGNWSYSLMASDLMEAGSDFSGTYTSSSNQVLIDVFQDFFLYNLFLNYRWRIDVMKSDIDWDSNLILQARRTGNGNPFWNFFPGNVTGGLSYQQITNSNQSFFNGRKSRYNIPIQYRISGVSVLIPAKTYITTIVYTVTEL